MGGDGSHWAKPLGPRYRYPQWVWSSTGGWWCDPKYWRSNTVKLIVGVLIPASITAFYFSAQRERHSKPLQNWAPELLYAAEYKKGGEWYDNAQQLRMKQTEQK